MSEEDTTSSSPVPVQPREKMAILLAKSKKLEELFLSSLVHHSLQQILPVLRIKHIYLKSIHVSLSFHCSLPSQRHPHQGLPGGL